LYALKKHERLRVDYRRLAMTQHIFETAEQVQQVYGAPRVARPRSLVRIRPIAGPMEVFATPTGELIGRQEQDLVVVPTDGSEPYPCKVSTFHQSWIETEAGSGLYRRQALAKVVPVPEGHEVVVRSKEGEHRIHHPDFIAIGIHGEVYANSAEWVASNLEFLPKEEAA
jgi:hypothetical protein